MDTRNFRFFPVKTANGDGYIIDQLLRWTVNSFDTAVLLNSNSHQGDQYGALPWVLAAGAHEELVGRSTGVFDDLKGFADAYQDWLFGFFSYELKNQVEKLYSKNPDHIGLPLCHFFRPVVLVMPVSNGLQIGTLPGHGIFSDPGAVFEMITGTDHSNSLSAGAPPVIHQRVSKSRYLKQVETIKNHIQAGDIYEMNYCIEFIADKAMIDPVSVYKHLNRTSATPFSGFYLFDNTTLMCASPERFLRKQGAKIISQPIKGTCRRGNDPVEDDRLKESLRYDPKERSENVMIVDLVRNDLSRTAQKGSVKVEELYGVYSFRQVHQMVSTVSARLDPGCHYIDAIRNAFPMGSMTGAPKIRAMQLIDKYEDSCRGLYSGAIGYINPEKDFDFNVVIRSILYNKKKKYLSYMAGSAITIGSEPEQEYRECLLKAKALGEAVRG